MGMNTREDFLSQIANNGYFLHKNGVFKPSCRPMEAQLFEFPCPASPPRHTLPSSVTAGPHGRGE